MCLKLDELKGGEGWKIATGWAKKLANRRVQAPVWLRPPSIIFHDFNLEILSQPLQWTTRQGTRLSIPIYIS